MKKYPTAQTGIFSLRVVLAVALCTIGGSFGWFSFASTPSSGTLSPGSSPITYDAGPLTPNQTPEPTGLVFGGPICNAALQCDNYALTITLPTGYVVANPGVQARVTLYWTNADPTNNERSDYDLYIYKGVVGNLSGSEHADWSSASGANPEVANITPLQDGTNVYTIKIVGFQPAGETVHVRIELLSGTPPNGFPGFGSADATAPGVPRYQIFNAAPAAADPGQGEYNIGYNLTTHRIMAYNGFGANVWRVTAAENRAPAKPECCAELWEQKSATSVGIVGLDPILWVDNWTDAAPLPMQPASGARVFVSQSTAGTNAAYAQSDNDGDSYTPTSASLPNASSDHQTIGSGPYPPVAGQPNPLANAVNHGHAVYYCGQTYPVGSAACQRSDTYGDSFGPSTLPYTGNAGDLCGGIHGHVRVGPDGTVYLPVRDCSGNAGVSVSTNAGITWTQHAVPNSAVQKHGSDPSIAIGANNTLYFFYIKNNSDNTEGHVHVQVSTDKGATWAKDTDLGISHGVINSAFPEAIAGDDNRAACGFLGTDLPGDYESQSFTGRWYLFMATTYDAGNTWNVVNTTPNDPVQGKGGIWQGGGSGVLNRNLLDFNEVTMDEKGRVLFGYSDGCVGTCVGNPDNNTFGALMRVARQIGGKSLFSANDVVEPVVPKAPCLSGTRDANGTHLNWKVPDNGGADIIRYNIYRGTASGNEVLIGQTNGPKTTFNDLTGDLSVAAYYKVSAVNSVDVNGGILSNEINFAGIPVATLVSVVSSKIHGGFPYNLDLPLDGSGIECRSGGTNGDHTLIFTFAHPLTGVSGASVTGGSGSVSSSTLQNGNYVVNLTGVANAQRTTVTLTDAIDNLGNTKASVSATVGALAGDTTGDGFVNSGDIAQTKSQSGKAVSNSNFREDVTVDGNLNSGDIALVKSKSGTALP